MFVTLRRLRFIGIALAGSLCPAAMVYAADQSAKQAGSEMEEVVVTGSRIPQPQLESISPVNVLSHEEIAKSGVLNVEELLNTLPQFTPDQSSNLAQGATGAATVNLRDLGTQRTLVLINGRRLMPGDPTKNGAGAPDLNNIPASMVQRVEVLTGSASATYGADAVAGVVNFIMNDHFQGFRIEGEFSANNHTQKEGWINTQLSARGFPAAPSGNITDGDKRSINATFGTDFADGRGNVTGYLGYQESRAVPGSARDFNNCVLQVNGTDWKCGGSSTSDPVTIFDNFGGVAQLAQDGSSFVPRYRRFNYGPDHFLQRDDNRFNGGFFAHYKMNDKAEAYGEFMFMRDETKAKYAPSGAFISSGKAPDPVFGVPDGNFYVNCGNGTFGSAYSNPFLNATTFGQLCDPADALGLVSSQQTVNGILMSQVNLGRRNTEGGGRTDDYTHQGYRAVVGARGNLTPAISYDLYAMLGVTNYTDSHQHDFSATRTGSALLAVIDPLTGDTVCLANANNAGGAPGCVPYNIFQPGGVTQNAVGYLQTPGYVAGAQNERVVSGYVNFDLGQYGVRLPTATNALVLNVGAESRQEHLTIAPDIGNISGDLSGSSPILPVDNGFGVSEYFTELRLPLIEDKAFAKSVIFDAGYRYSDYTVGFKTDTYKVGLQWAPNDSFRLRGSYQRAVRAPNIQELYQPTSVQLDGGSDPCAGDATTPPTFSQAQCALMGVSAAQYGHIAPSNAGQYNGLLGGNPNLKPEKATTTSFGLVFTPTFLRNFSATIDYFDIKVTDLIGVYGADFILSQCGTTGDPKWCNAIHRSSNGSIWTSPLGFVTDLNVNSGSQRTSGIDLQANYSFGLGKLGNLHIGLNGSYVSKFELSPFGGTSYDCVGTYGVICVTPLPKWRHTANFTWATPVSGLDATLDWRYVHTIKVEYDNPQMANYNPNTGIKDERLPAISYFDLSASYKWRKVTARAGIRNILDKDPPLVGSDDGGNSVFYENNTFPSLYDTLGRHAFLSFSADF